MGRINREQLGEWLSAYLDGEVNDEQRALIERLLREDDVARRQYEELRRTVDLVSSLPRHAAPNSIAADVQAFAERNELVGDVGTQGAGAGRKRSPLVPLLSMAATLALVATGVWYASDLAGTSTPTHDVLVDATRPAEKGASRKRSQPRRSRGAAKPEAEASVVPEALLATATFDQKLQSGVGVAALREHQFSNEPFRLRVAVDNEVDRDIVAARLVGTLKKQAATDLKRVDAASTSGQPGGPFFFEGSGDVNFKEAGQRQVLVRVSRAELQELMEEMSRATTGEKEFALAAGPISVRGFDRTQAMITGLEESAVSLGATERFADADADDMVPFDAAAENLAPQEGKAEEAVTSFDGVLKVVGLDAAKLKQDFAAAPEQEGAETAQVDNESGERWRTERVADGGRGPAAAPGPVAQQTIADSDTSAARDRSADRTGQKKSIPASPFRTKAGSRKELAGEDSNVIDSETTKAPDSLVARRMRALDKDKRQIDRAEPFVAGGQAGDGGRTVRAAAADVESRAAGPVGSPSGGYVTLVIELTIDRPATSKPTPPVRTRSGKPTKEGAKQ